jgi:hypothetical protein
MNMNDAMQDIVDKYLASGGGEPMDLDELADFAIENNHWDRGISHARQLCKKDFSRAFRERYHKDPQGRNVRTFHAVKKVSGSRQQVLWADMRTVDAEHMEEAFSQRRRQIVGECKQLNNDVESYNENNTHSGYFQLELDFNVDILESSQSTEYAPKLPK